ncbi:MAG: hypothetical protein ACRDGA_13350, partial [Bacteroidota bacterium]
MKKITALIMLKVRCCAVSCVGIILILLAGGLAVDARAKEGDQQKKTSVLLKSAVTQHAVFDANRISNIMMNNGQYVSHLVTGNNGLEWPKGSGKLIDFAAGLWIAGKARSDGSIRTAVTEYASEYQPGKILPNGQPDDPTLPKYRWYKITSADLKDPGEDYRGWPVGDGAPVDASGKPLLLGDQTLWCVFNDVDTSLHNRLFGTPPLGIEVQMTVWGYDRPEVWGDMMFVKATIIHKDTETFDSTFIGLWDDADLGNASDDYIGCDTTLSLGYFWNATNNDEAYGAAPPAIGRAFLQGPIVHSPGDTASFLGRKLSGYRNLRMGAFSPNFKGSYPFRDPQNAQEVFNYLRGRALDGSAFVNPLTGQKTLYYFTGDPETSSGWTESNPVRNAAGDRRFTMSTGPLL